MTEKLQIYKCAVCGNIAEMVHAGAGQMVCCGQPMTLFKENTTDAAKEKHVPVIERTAEGLKVKVGSVSHPMDQNHYIEMDRGHCRRQSLPSISESGRITGSQFCH